MTPDEIDAMRATFVTRLGITPDEAEGLVVRAVQRDADVDTTIAAWRAAVTLVPVSPVDPELGRSDRSLLVSSILLNDVPPVEASEALSLLGSTAVSVGGAPEDAVWLAVNAFDHGLDPAAVATTLVDYANASVGPVNFDAIHNLHSYDPWFGSLHSPIDAGLIPTAVRAGMSGADVAALCAEIARLVPEYGANASDVSFFATQAIDNGMSAAEVAESIAADDGRIVQPGHMAIS